MSTRKPLGRKATSEQKLRQPWLVATWPGMGSVAALAGGHLAQALRAQPTTMIPEGEFFAIDHVEVSHGIARSGRLPRSMFFQWRDPDERRDLLMFLGEAQPPSGGYALCHRILDHALQRDVERVVTFAAMATTMRPSAEPRVMAAVTAPELLPELRSAGVELLVDGHIGGLNGALLAAAAERGVPAMCLLGEMPYFAAGLPNPKASLAVLRAFAILSGIEPRLDALAEQAREIDPKLAALFDQLQDSSQRDDDAGEESPAGEQASDGTGAARLTDDDRRRIEELFEAAIRDRSQAPRLKAELDRLGVFRRYEDRFLDLFRRGE
jgi:hypothetical protein